MVKGKHKGDPHSGGGGSTGGGGKQRRPPEGWEKGDVARTKDAHHTDAQVPIQPGRDRDRKAEQKDAARQKRRTLRDESKRE